MRLLVLFPLAAVLAIGCSSQDASGPQGTAPGKDKEAPPIPGDKGGITDKTPPQDKPADIRPIGKRNEKPAVEVLVNNEFKDWWASKCKLGERICVRGYILNSKGTWIRVNNCRPYDGPEKSAAASVLTRDFQEDWDKAHQKYKRSLAAPRFDHDIVVDGFVAGWDPDKNVLVLAGHAP